MQWTAACGGEASCALRSYEGFRALEVLPRFLLSLCVTYLCLLVCMDLCDRLQARNTYVRVSWRMH